MKIKNWKTNEIIFEDDSKTIKKCLENGIKKGINFLEADLREADLRNADLLEADLRKADLREAILREADMRGANLLEADLRKADLRGADLWKAILREADLREADLRNAILREADLREADLRKAILPHYKICPSGGSFMAWKKVSGCVVQLKIPAWARRTSSLVGRKCRAEFSVVVDITNKRGKRVAEAVGDYDQKTIYKIGKIVTPDKYDGDPRVECSHGIHFFVTREEAERY